MATWVLSECGFRPLPKLYPTPRTRIHISNFPNSFKPSPSKILRPNFPALKVSAPASVQILDHDQNEQRPNGFKFQESGFKFQESEFKDQESGFDPGAPPPFTLADIRAAIPKHCWVKNPWRSMGYVFWDVAVVFGLAVVAAYFNNMVVWPLYWFALGTMFWALFVGHDCGHGSFSSNAKLNSVVGHLLHSSIPYHGWRISHRTHHQNHGHVENDESWHPGLIAYHHKIRRPSPPTFVSCASSAFFLASKERK